MQLSCNISGLFIRLEVRFIFEFTHRINHFSIKSPYLLMLISDSQHQLIPTYEYISQAFHIVLFNLVNQVYRQLMHFSFFLLVNNKEQIFTNFYQLQYLIHIKFLRSIQYQGVTSLVSLLHSHLDKENMLTLINSTDTYSCL